MKRWYYYLKGLFFGKKIYLQFDTSYFRKGDIVIPEHLKLKSNLKYLLNVPVSSLGESVGL